MSASSSSPEHVGRYVLFDEIASGGMATVHLARQRGAVGFARTVAVKRLHPQLAKDPEFTSMFLDEARLASRVRHPSVVSTLDVVSTKSELLLVMEYVHGESLARLLRNVRGVGGAVPPAIASAIACDVLGGLGAAHEATDEQGTPLTIVHRDVSPQNVLVGTDGVARLVDFGVAKAIGRLTQTQDGQVKGKTSYMSPEQLRGKAIDHRTDLYAAGVVLWEALVGERLFLADNAMGTMNRVLEDEVRPPSAIRQAVPAALDVVVLKSISRDVNARFSTAAEMAAAIEAAQPRASAQAVAAWVAEIAKEEITERTKLLANVEKALPARHDASDPAVSEIVEERESSRRRAVREEDLSTSTVPAMTSHSSSHERAGGSRRVMWLVALALIALVVSGGIGLAIVVALRSRPPSTVSASTTTATASPSAEPSAEPSVATLPTTTATPPPLPPPTATVTASATHPAPSTKKPTVRPAGSTRPKCNPPYTVDSTGVRVPKPECF